MKTPPPENRDDVDRLLRLANPVATEDLPDSRSAAAETLYARLLLTAEPRATVRDSQRRAGRPRRLIVAVAVASLLLVTGAALAAVRYQGQASEEPLAFQRAKRPADVFDFRLHRVLDSRRIASYVDPRGQKAELFVAEVGADERFTEEQHCVYLRDSGAGSGGGCSTAGSLLRPGTINVGSSRLLSGITANDVARVVVVGSRGVRNPVRLTPDKGFIFDCRSYNGCFCLIHSFEAYAADGRLLSRQPANRFGCARRR